MSYQNVTVSVNITDTESGVKTVTLYYTNDTVWHNVPMAFNNTSTLWEAIIPGYMEGTQVKYRIEAYDNAGNMAVEDNAGQYYAYTVIPEFLSSLILLLVMVLSVLAVVLAKRKLPRKPDA